MTDPSPRAGFTVGSLAEVERSLLPLLPSSLSLSSYPDPIIAVSPTFSLGFDPSPRPLCRLLTAPSTFYSITGNLSLFSRCPYPYLSFVLLSIVLRFFHCRRPMAPSRLPARATAPSRTIFRAQDNIEFYTPIEVHLSCECISGKCY